jgi:hypothetical protein
MYLSSRVIRFKEKMKVKTITLASTFPGREVSVDAMDKYVSFSAEPA